VQLEWPSQFPGQTQSSSSSFSTPSSVIHNKIDHFGLNEIKKRLIEYLAAVRLKELNADKEAAATTVDARRLLNKLKPPPYRCR